MDSDSGSYNEILIKNNINFYEEGGFKYFEAADYNPSNNSIVTLASCFDEKYRLVTANVTVNGINFDIKNYQGELDLEILKSMASLSTTSLMLDFNNNDYQILISENDKINPIDLGPTFFGYEALKEDNYMYMDEMDHLVNYVIVASTHKRCPIKPVDFQNIEKRFKNKTKIIAFQKIAS